MGGRRLSGVECARGEVEEMVSAGEDRGGRRMSSSFVSRNEPESNRRAEEATTSLHESPVRDIEAGRRDMVLVARQTREEGGSPSSPLSGLPGSPSRSLALLQYNYAKTFHLLLRRKGTLLPISLTRACPADTHTY